MGLAKSYRFYTGDNVFDAALNRFEYMYRTGKVVISFSAGKDSGVMVELALIAKQMYGISDPVIVIMRDEEIMLPGTFEYAERIANRPGVEFHWIYANQPVVNAYNRREPYFWVFDPILEPDDWVRTPPDFAYAIPEMNIEALVTHERFGWDKDTLLYNTIGIRTSESPRRVLAIKSSKGYLTKNHGNIIKARPLYDWTDGDVWKFIKDYGLDYNEAYDTMFRSGISKQQLRIAPPTMSSIGLKLLQAAARAWPKWFDRVSERLPGVRMAVNYGKKAIMPFRRYGETWEDCFNRACIKEAPEWIAERAEKQKQVVMKKWFKYSSQPFPQKRNDAVKKFNQYSGSWEELTKTMYNGDPFAMKAQLPYVEPERFRPGGGYWGGKPTF